MSPLERTIDLRNRVRVFLREKYGETEKDIDQLFNDFAPLLSNGYTQDCEAATTEQVETAAETLLTHRAYRKGRKLQWGY